MTQHSRDDALTDREFERLLRGARTLPDPQAFEARLVIHAAGRLGLRGGEIAHLAADWIDLDRRMVDVPEHDECTKGKDGGVCGYCRERAAEHVESYNYDLEEAREVVLEDIGDVDISEAKVDELARDRIDDRNITLDEAIAERWEPKTTNGVRSIPYDFDVRTELTIEEFQENYSIFPKARVGVNRRVREAAEAAGLEDVYPHALRATAATRLALNDVSAYSLMGVLGWARIDTARAYIRSSSETAAKEVRAKHR